MKRLSQPSGEVADNSPQKEDTADKVVRPAILVHAGPNGSVISFASGDGEIKFDAARIKRVVSVFNAQADKLAAEYGGDDKVPMGAHAPVLDQHESDSNDRIRGRLSGRLFYEVRDVPKVGKNVPCAVMRPGITFLGKHTVECVLDGRIFHLSIGINEEDDSLGETSTVIEPAAPGAMLLSRGEKQTKRGEPKMPNLKRMQAHANRMAKLSAFQTELTTLSSKLTSSKEIVRLAKKTGEVTHRLTGLMRSGKLTPAEYKKMDIKRLAALNDDALGVVLGTIEAMEPKVDPTQRGSTAAVDFATMGKTLEKTQLKRLRSEIAGDFKRLSGKKMSFDDAGEDKDHGDTHEMEGGNKETPVAPGKDEHAVPDQAGEVEMAHMAHMKKLGDCLAAGDMGGAKEAHAAMAAHLEKSGMKHMEIGDVKSEDYSKSMSSLESQVDELTTQMGRMAGMVKELMGAEQEEGHDLEAGDEEESEVKTPEAK